MCFTCLQNKCLELSDYVYGIKHKLTDEEFKYMLEQYQNMFTQLKNMEERTESSHEEPEPESEEDESEEEETDEINVYTPRLFYTLDISVYAAINIMLYPEETCECECDTRSSNHTTCRSMRSCSIYKILVDRMPALSYIVQLSENKIPHIPSTFVLQTTPVHSYLPTTTLNIVMNEIGYLMKLVNIFNKYEKEHCVKIYIGFIIITIYDHIFKNIDICKKHRRFKDIVLNKIDEFTGPASISKLEKANELIPHIDIIHTFRVWKSELESI